MTTLSYTICSPPRAIPVQLTATFLPYLQTIVADYQTILMVTDGTVAALHASACLESLQTQFPTLQISSCILTSGEAAKTWTSLQSIIAQLLALQAQRKSTLLIGLGGGTIGDMTGFAASCYKRGIDYVTIPTTLLAMVDASVGGKTAINSDGYKNMVGSFYHPRRVLIDPCFLDTLPDEQRLSGLMEACKHALLDSPAHRDDFAGMAKLLLGPVDSNEEAIMEALARSIRVKQVIVQQDEKEAGMRKYLNYGHTMGHALESARSYEIPHGICVGRGMVYDNLLSQELGLMSPRMVSDINQRIISLLGSSTLQTPTLPAWDTLFTLMQQDKKNTDHTTIVFSLLEGIGKPTVTALADVELLARIWSSFVSLYDICHSS